MFPIAYGYIQIMNRNHLALFHAVAQGGGISRGAELARVSQPAVSKQIAELEAALGVDLLERLPRGCRLTEAGALLADYARRWLAVEAEAERAIAEYRNLKRGRLAVGASLTIGAYLLPRAIAEFHRRHPEIELHLEIANTERIEQALLDGAVDLGLTEGPLGHQDLDSQVFFRDELVAIAPAGHPLLRRSPATVRELCHEPLILREKGSGTRAVVEEALRRKGIDVVPLLSLASPAAIKNAVAAGLGVAIVSRLIIGPELASGQLGVVKLKDLTIHRPFHRQRMKDRRESPSVKGFLEVLDGEIQRASHH
jgi:DNA-binding transcriptional LysR family regulator